jgi:hypothetical protein
VAERLEAVVVSVAFAPTTIQAFWQFMACVSQPTRQAVEACEDINGVGVRGTG